MSKNKLQPVVKWAATVSKGIRSGSRSTCILGLVVLLVGFESRVCATVGAITPFTSYEAEAGLLSGGAAVVSVTSAPTTEYSSPQLEASGHAYVQLTVAGQSVTWTNTTGQTFTAINLRSCIPDAPTGGGITNAIDFYVNGVFRQNFSVNSLQNYCYEGTNYNGQTDKNPADGDPRGFWNDTHAFIVGAPINPSDTFTFQMDMSNTAAFYYIDVVDLENPPAPSSQPANSVSILTYNAVSNSIGTDNTAAINNCFNAARSSSSKIAWIPPGTYYFSAINGGLNASGITILGAGPWYSTLYRVTPAGNSQGVANIITTTSCTISNLSLDCNGTDRAGNINNGAVNSSGTNWVVDNVWIQHATSSFWCAGVNGIAKNCRVLSVWSDGGNFNNVQSNNGLGNNLTYSNNFVRGTGDDAMAINSVGYNVNGTTTNFYTIMSNIRYVNNTAIAPWGGKCMGIYGGSNDVVTNNLLCDTARYIGLGVMRFGVNGSDIQSATVMGNVVIRGGGNGYSQQQQAMMIGNGGDGQSVGTVANAYCAYNIISNSLYDAVGFSTSSNIVLQYNTIISPGLDAIAAGPPDLGSGVRGNAIIYSNTVTGLNAGKFAITNNAISYAMIIPVAATNYNSMSGVTTEACAEGGLDVTGIVNGDWTAYNNVNLTGVNTFVARVASAGSGGQIQVYLDSPTGTPIGTCTVPATGGAQTYVNAYCGIANSGGPHTVYLVYTGGAGSLFNMEYFGFYYLLGQAVTGPPRIFGAVHWEGDLLVNLQSADLSGTGKVWTNRTSNAQSVGNFTTIGGGNLNVASVTYGSGPINTLYVNTTGNNSVQSALVTPTEINGPNPVSVEVWIITTNVAPTSATLNYGYQATSQDRDFNFDTSGHGAISGNNADTGWTTAPTTNVWHYLAYTFDGVVFSAYLDGKLDKSASLALNTHQNHMQVGSDIGGTGSNGGNDPFHGYIAAARVCSGVLSAYDVATNYTFGPLGSAAAITPAGLTAVAGDGQVALAWNVSSNAMGYNVKRSTNSGGTYVLVATNLAALNFTNTGLANGTNYYFVVSATNSAGESTNSTSVSARPVSTTSPQISVGVSTGQIQFAWPPDHLGWELEVQTNVPGAGLGSNWVVWPGSAATNQMIFLTDPVQGSVFFRLVYP